MREPAPQGVTRRALIAGAAAGAAGAYGVLSGSTAAAAEVASPAVFSRWIGDLGTSSGVLAAPREFALVGVQWDRPAGARIELRVRAPGGSWSRWGTASVLGHAPDAREAASAPAAQIGSPLWAGRARWVELRSTRALRGVRLHFVAPQPAVASPADVHASAAATALAQPVLPAGPGQPPIIARNAWAHGHARPKVSPEYGAVKLAFVHHTDNLNGYSAGQVPGMIYSIYLFHRFSNGWNDIGYNFVIDAFGRIWEARQGGIDLPVTGAHAGGYNLESTGVAVLGTFTNAVPSDAAISALERLVAWKLSLHGVPASGQVTVEVNPNDAFYTPFSPGAHVSLPRVAGHRQGCSTDCPGNAFFARLPAVRANIQQLAGQPAALTLTVPGPGTRAESYLSLAGANAFARVPRPVIGRLTTLNGDPIAGAPIELQRVGSGAGHTIAEAVTDPLGGWAAELSLTSNSLIRAVHRLAPAVVSELIAVAVGPLITLTLAGASPLVIAGTVAPATGPVTVTLYALSLYRRVQLRQRRVKVGHDGRFTVDFGARPPGAYEVTATTAAKAAHAPGAATPLPITI